MYMYAYNERHYWIMEYKKTKNFEHKNNYTQVDYIS